MFCFVEIDCFIQKLCVLLWRNVCSVLQKLFVLFWRKCLFCFTETFCFGENVCFVLQKLFVLFWRKCLFRFPEPSCFVLEKMFVLFLQNLFVLLKTELCGKATTRLLKRLNITHHENYWFCVES